TDAGVPEFMDFMLQERESMQAPMRGGLAWLDTECRRRFGNTFAAGTDAQRRAVLDDIAWPARAKPEYSHGVAFFNSFRDLTASGFWSSKMGIEDLQYLGNKFVREWTGCPPAALAKLGVRYS
ncbi:MAG: gluconate 2-dehydrogenase subunit 3 family protein, partial [Burkholderiales bacterium]